jgi:hypothetical protein
MGMGGVEVVRGCFVSLPFGSRVVYGVGTGFSVGKF